MTTPLRELERKWRGEVLPLPTGTSVEAITARGLAKSYNCALISCADELAAALSAMGDGVDSEIDFEALEIARRFTSDAEPQRRASLQVAIVEAMRRISRSESSHRNQP